MLTRLNPHRSAITHGMSHVIGDVAVGKLADLVLWSPANFGVRPETVLKGGVIAWANVSPSSPSPLQPSSSVFRRVVCVSRPVR